MRNELHINLLALAVSSAVCANAWALEPQSIKLADGVNFTPTLKVSESYDDNFRAVEKNTESTWITTIAPTFTLGAEGRKSAYKISYTAVSDTFHSSQKDNNTDHHLTADVGMEFNARNRMKLNAGYHNVENTTSLDQNQRITSNYQNDKYNTKNIGGVYTYGAESARAQLDLGANYEELRYTNSNHINADKERDTTALRTTLYYRVAPKTKILLEGRYTDYDYVSNTPRNSSNIGLLTGLTWEATAKTTGSVKFGREKKRFDDSRIGDKSTGMWEVGATWEPRTYSHFSLTTRSSFDEGYGYDNTNANASTIKTRSTTLSWKHDWAERLSSDLSYTRTDQDYQDINRKDKINTYGIGLNYAMRRWLDIGIGYKYAENNSDAVNASYERNTYAITLNASL